jgi:hypothetical protein
MILDLEGQCLEGNIINVVYRQNANLTMRGLVRYIVLP